MVVFFSIGYEILMLLSAFHLWLFEIGAGFCDMVILDVSGLVSSCQCELYTEEAGD